MSEFLTKSEINQFNEDGAIFLKGKFDVFVVANNNSGNSLVQQKKFNI